MKKQEFNVRLCDRCGQKLERDQWISGLCALCLPEVAGLENAERGHVGVG